METVVGVEGNDEAMFEESAAEKSSSASESSKQIADPVVYKLVRVQGDGRLVPATEDEVMEVEDLLEDDKTEIHIIEDTGQTVGCVSNDGPFSREHLNESSEGVLKSENAEVDADKLNARREEIVTSSPPTLGDSHFNQSGSVAGCPKSPDEPVGSISSASAVCTSSKPLFSSSNGEICLDNLSIKELHDTFKATFGRETTVKDKQWLKRRIAMGLTNSCDVSTTTFIIRDNKLVKTGKEESCMSVDGTTKDPTVEAVNDSCRDSPISHNSGMEDHQIDSGKGLGNTCVDHDYVSDDLHTEQRAVKRLRKPTRRYIEELSEVESREFSGKILSSAKDSGHGLTNQKSLVKPGRNVSSDGRAVVTRMDSLGGSGVQVPYVSRIRRSRPRKNVMALMKFHPSGTGMAAKLVKKALGVRNSQPDNELGNEVVKAKSSPCIQQPLVASTGKDMQCPPTDMVELEQKVDSKHIDSSGDASDENVVTVPTAKGGMRRKHHRAWTMSEVMKLVEGVSRYGAGRWSEIKRVAFASYSYRTSVDLKDKWRNLLRASFAQTPSDNAMNSRKHVSTPIPAPILIRVRELAEMHAQVPPNFSSSKMVDSGGRNVHQTRSGYL